MKGEKMCKMIQKVSSKNPKNRCKCGQSTNLDALRLKIRCETNRRRRLWESVWRKRPELWPDKWILRHDSAPVHEFLAKKSVTKIYHPPYSPDLVPCDFWLFPELKMPWEKNKNLLTFMTSNAM
jgi:hypothetical protein